MTTTSTNQLVQSFDAKVAKSTDALALYVIQHPNPTLKPALTLYVELCKQLGKQHQDTQAALVATIWHDHAGTGILALTIGAVARVHTWAEQHQDAQFAERVKGIASGVEQIPDDLAPKGALSEPVETESPEAVEAMRRAADLIKTVGINHPDTHAAISLAMSLASHEWNSLVASTAVQTALAQNSDGHLEDGTPAYAIERAATFFGLDLDEVKADPATLYEKAAAYGITLTHADAGDVHRSHRAQARESTFISTADNISASRDRRLKA